MSKKLIAVAAAAALALTGLVATPANASTITKVAITTNQSNTISTTNVPSHAATTDAVTAATAMTSRTLDFLQTGTTTRNVVRFDVTTASAAPLAISSTNGVKVIAAIADAAGKAFDVTAGSTTLSAATTTGALTYSFFAFTTSTTAGAVVIDSGTTKTTHYVKSLAGAPYNLTNVKFPATVISGQPDDATNANIVTWNVTDVFGNSIETLQGTLTGFSSAGSASVAGAAWKATPKVNSAYIHGTVGSSVSLSLSLTAPDYSLNGWPKPVKSAFTTVTGGDLAAQVTTLTAQVAALTATIANMRTKAHSVTLKRWNNLVKRHRALGGSAKLKTR